MTTRKRALVLAAVAVAGVTSLTVSMVSQANAAPAPVTATGQTIASIQMDNDEQFAPQTANDCMNFLILAGYDLLPNMASACAAGETGGPGGAICFAGLRNAGVTAHDAEWACMLADG
jgi:hypothetical protein